MAAQHLEHWLWLGGVKQRFLRAGGGKRSLMGGVASEGKWGSSEASCRNDRKNESIAA